MFCLYIADVLGFISKKRVLHFLKVLLRREHILSLEAQLLKSNNVSIFVKLDLNFARILVFTRSYDALKKVEIYS